MKKLKTQKGITLMALVITIIVMLILVTVTITIAVNGGLFNYAGIASGKTKNAIDEEQALANGRIKIADKWYASIDDYLAEQGGQNAKWDKNATDEKYFVWGSNDPKDGLYYRLLGINEEYASELPENIVLPSRCMDIYHNAFYASTYYYDETIVNALTNIKSIKIPNTTVSIGTYAFSGCTNLEDIGKPEGIVCIGKYAFYNTAWYSKQKDGLIIVGKVVYEYKGSPTDEYINIEIPEEIVHVADSAFNVEGEHTERGFASITLPNSLKSIGRHAFWKCVCLGSVIIPSSVTEVGAGAFEGCIGLRSVTISEGITSIGTCVFSGCKGLINITIPNSVTYIEDREGYAAFSGLPSSAVFHVVEGSYAEEWAKNKGYNVQYNNKL